jgi:hypothetical protein
MIGMKPILPAFAGHVGEDLIQKYPTVSYYKLQHWTSFSPENIYMIVR